MFHVATFYKFVALPDYTELRAPLKARMEALGIKGSILLAEEGINATISGERAALEAMLAHLRADARLSDLETKESLHETQPFARAKVRLKKEIVTLGTPVDPTRAVGAYVEAQDWNALIDDADTLVIDTRNDYEVHLGQFKNALNPGTLTFRQFPAFVRENLDPARHKKIAMYCTGGIRCEKFSSYLVEQGFEEVYHLKGGILKYLEDIPEAESRWEGDCYVFDERIAVGYGLAPSPEVSMCRNCGHPLTPEDRAHKEYVEDQSCGHCDTARTARRNYSHEA